MTRIDVEKTCHVFTSGMINFNVDTFYDPRENCGCVLTGAYLAEKPDDLPQLKSGKIYMYQVWEYLQEIGLSSNYLHGLTFHSQFCKDEWVNGQEDRKKVIQIVMGK